MIDGSYYLCSDQNEGTSFRGVPAVDCHSTGVLSVSRVLLANPVSTCIIAIQNWQGVQCYCENTNGVLPGNTNELHSRI